ncbi:MAG: Rieske (2Fe-2S) protein [Pseudomonadales bacterium]|jgi:nitrite reductase/ring-hydroxylating ferredoxin subunit|nr:Rieske (2Fe-2S) protein [Pseudomonadales bacterium]
MIFFPLIPLTRLHDGFRQVFTLDGIDYLLLQHAGKRYLLENDCPHAAYPMHEGKILGHALRCPMHGYLFDLDTGACTYYTEGPCHALRRLDLVERDGHLGLWR